MYVNADGSVLPCCIADHHQHLGNTQQNKIIDIWNSDEYKTLRKNMIEGKACSQCNACYSSEEQGNKSFRQSVNQQFAEYLPYADKTNADGSLDEMNLHYFDVRWSNICNFKCRSCSSTYSSSWATEDKKDKVFIFAGGKDNNDLYEQFKPHLQNMKEIYFAGGEPLLTDKHYEILQHLIDTKNTKVKLRYNTNLSALAYKGKPITDYWNKFSTVIVYASLDSWGDRAEYIREGTDWEDLKNNIQTIKDKCPHVVLEMSSVISAFNVATVTDFLDYLFENKIFDRNKFKPSFYNMINPDYYNFSIIDDKTKEQIIDKIKSKSYNNHINSQLNSVINQLQNSTFDLNLQHKFKLKTQHYDELRKRNFKQTFPEIGHLL
jgi:MoaA/NifB/PqqE/SkfB family radical SAM enzyme